MAARPICGIRKSLREDPRKDVSGIISEDSPRSPIEKPEAISDLVSAQHSGGGVQVSSGRLIRSAEPGRRESVSIVRADAPGSGGAKMGDCRRIPR